MTHFNQRIFKGVQLLFCALCTSCSTQEQIADSDFPVDSLLNVPEYWSLNNGARNGQPVFHWWAQEATLYWVAEDPKYPSRVVVLTAHQQQDTYFSPAIPLKWQTRDSLVASMSIDDLQRLNGKPFFLYSQEGYFRVKDWNGGKVSSNAEMAFFGPQLPREKLVVSSKELLDNHLELSPYSLTVWNDRVRKLTTAGGRLPGKYAFASARTLTDADLRGHDVNELAIMRDEIYARHGMVFTDPDAKMFFNGMPWYEPKYLDVDQFLRDVERKNIDIIDKRTALLSKRGFFGTMIHELPLLTLPLDLDKLPQAAITLSPDVPVPNGEKGSATCERLVYGVLPDTGNYYGIIWRGGQFDNGSIVNTPEKPLFLTTLGKNFQPISTAIIRLDVERMTFEEGSKCTSTEEKRSVVETDLSFLSIYAFKYECPDQGGGTANDTISGFVSPEGTITLKGNR